jgi:hypothetical protein
VSDERETFEYKIADGKVYIQIRQAERRTYTDYSSGKGDEKEEIQPRVWISTDPEFKADTDLGYVKVRGRKYAIEHTVKRLPDGEARLGRIGITHWQSETSYRGGYRNDRGGPVSYEAKAYDSLHEIEREALDRFHEEHPEWVTESARLYFEYEVDRHRSKAKRLRQEAHTNEGKANDWQKRIDELAA